MGREIIDVKQISKKDVSLIKWVIGIPSLFFIGFVLYMFLTKENINNVIKKTDLNEEFSGNVDTIFRDKSNHNVQTVRLTNGYVYTVTPAWENHFKVGDSLSKKKNSLELEVYRKNKLVLILDYNDTYKK